MPVLSGQQLEQIRELSTQWYVQTRQKLIKALEMGTPYGAVHLSPEEQYMNFVGMQPEDWSALIAQLNNRYRGLPNQRELVNSDLTAYTRKMLEYRGKAGGRNGNV